MARALGSPASVSGMIAVSVIVGVCHAVRAGGAPIFLVWTAPPDCPSRDSVLARTEQLAGRPADEAHGETAQRVEAVVDQPDADVWRLRLTSLPPQGLNRTLTAHSCTDLADAAALFLALSLDNGPDSVPPGSQESPRTSAPAAAPSASPLPTGGPVRAHLGVMAAAETGRLPGIAPGAVVEGGAGWHRWQAHLPLAFFPTQRTTLARGSADLWMGSAGLGVGRIVLDRPALVPYAKFEVALIHGHGTGGGLDRSGDTVLLEFAAGLDASFMISEDWSLSLRGEIGLPVLRPGFVFDSGADVHRPEQVGFQLGTGARFRGF